MCKPFRCPIMEYFSNLQLLKLLQAPTFGCKTTDQVHKAIQCTGWICAKGTVGWAGPRGFVKEIWNEIVNSSASGNQVLRKKKCVGFSPPPSLKVEPALSTSASVVGFDGCPAWLFLKHTGTACRNTDCSKRLSVLEIPWQTDLNYMTPWLSMWPLSCWQILAASIHRVVGSSAHIFGWGALFHLEGFGGEGKEPITTTILAGVGSKSRNSLWQI